MKNPRPLDGRSPGHRNCIVSVSCWLPLVLAWLIFPLAVGELCIAQDENWEAGFLSDRYSFRWNLKPGQKYLVELEQKTTVNTRIGTMDLGKNPSRFVITQEWTVQERDSKRATILQTITRLRVEMSAPTIGQLKVDTSEDAEDTVISKQVHAQMSQLIGRQFSMTISPLGRVVNVQPVASDDDGDDKNAFSKMFNRTKLKTVFSQVASFEDLSVKPGDRWSNQVKVDNGQLDLEYTFDEDDNADDNFLTIQIEPRLEVVGNDQLSIESQSANGEIRYSTQLQVPVETHLKQNLVLKILADDRKKEPMIRSEETETTVRITLQNPGTAPTENAANDSSPDSTGSDE